MQILALGGVCDWPAPATGCDMANELLCPFRTNYGSLHSASILSVSPPRSQERFLNGPRTPNTAPSAPAAPGTGRSSARPWRTQASRDFLKMALPDGRNPGSARNSPLRKAPACKKNNNNNNNNNFLLAVGKKQESVQGLGVSALRWKREASQSWTFAKTSDLKSNSLQHFIAASAAKSPGPRSDTKE